MIPRVAVFMGSLLVGCISLAGCNAQAASTPGPKVALVATASGFGDRSYNDEAAAGLAACKRKSGIEIAALAPKSDDDGEPQLALFATEDYDAVIAIGFGMAHDLAQVARRFQGTHCAIIDATVDEPNVESITFNEQEGAFLAGSLAAMFRRPRSSRFSVARISRCWRGPRPGLRPVPARSIHTFGCRPVSWLLHGPSWRPAAPRPPLRSRRRHIAFVVAGRAGLGALEAATGAKSAARGKASRPPIE